MMAPPTIVIIEDDPAIMMVLDRVLTRAGYTTIGWVTGTPPQQLIQQAQPDLVILDLTLDHRTGESVLERMVQDAATKDIPVIICSGQSTTLQETAARFPHTVRAALTKPFELAEVLETVSRVLEPPAARE